MIHATIGECALAENGVEIRDWWDICGTFLEPVYDTNDSLNESYEIWLEELRRDA
jgi:hypothetical protein